MEELLNHRSLIVVRGVWRSVRNQHDVVKQGAGDDQWANAAALGCSGVKLGQVGHARLSLPLSIRAGQWRWGRWRGRGRGLCQGLRGQGLWERRHRNTSADSETISSFGRHPMGARLDSRMPLQVGDGRSGDRQLDSSREKVACARSPHTHTHSLLPGSRGRTSSCYQMLNLSKWRRQCCDCMCVCIRPRVCVAVQRLDRALHIHTRATIGTDLSAGGGESCTCSTICPCWCASSGRRGRTTRYGGI